MTMPKKYRVAVIGHTGRGNYGHGIDMVWREMSNCEIVAVADADSQGLVEATKRLNAPKAYSDYRQMLDEAKPDIVGIGPRWVDQHRDMVVAAAQRGIHMYMEKPMCRSLEEADAMIAACEKTDVKFAIAHQTRYSPKLQVVRDMIEQGQLGKVLELRGRGKEDQRGGSEDLWVLGSHVMNLIHFFGGEPNWCFSSIRDDDQPITKANIVEGAEGLGPLAGSNIAAMYGMDHGATAYFASVRGTAGGRFGLQIMGSKGVVEVLTGHLPAIYFLPDPNWSPGRSNTNWIPVTTAGPGKPETQKDGGLHGGNLLAVKDLIAAIEEDRLPECDIYEARLTIEMIAAVFESQRLGAPVQFPLKNRKNPLTML
jgi:predicted dehydrogenase